MTGALRDARVEAWLDALPMALAVYDASLMLEFANARFRVLAGLEPAAGAEPLARGDLAVARDDLASLIAAGREAATPHTTRLACDGGDGPRWVDVTVVPLAPARGEAATGVAVLASDVTAREELHAHLAANVAQLSAIFERLPESVRVLDRDGRITRSNDLALRGDADPPARTLDDLFARERPTTIEGMRCPPDRHPARLALAGEAPRNRIFVVQRGGAEIVVEVNANPFRDAGGAVRGAIVVERDITERVRLAQHLEEQVRAGSSLYSHVATEAERLEQMVQARTSELLALQEAVARDRRLAAVGQLAAGVMHDVNNALNPIMAAAYLLGRNADDPVLVRDYARRIQKAAETGAATAARVGRFIRQEPLTGRQEQRFDLTTAVNEALEIAQSSWTNRVSGGTVELIRDLTPGLALYGIAGELREAMLSLVSNAVDAMPTGGVLTVAARAVDAEVLLEVRDTGTGMTTDVRERAFDPFFSTKGTAGSGLGLSEVYGIARRHRGRAEITSEPGRGTIVRLRFPHVAPALPEAPPRARTTTPRRVLLVEDHGDARRLVRELLESDGHSVVESDTLADARARMGPPASAPRFDVVVTDIFLPDGNGWDFVAELRRKFPHVRVGIVTGWELAPPPSVAADFTLRKPLAARELLECVAG